jgi:hypothetical protein
MIVKLKPKGEKCSVIASLLSSHIYKISQEQFNNFLTRMYNFHYTWYMFEICDFLIRQESNFI